MVNCNKERYDFADLLEIMKTLRSPGGCPWDREQTHKSIRKNFLEEVYEVCEAIDTENDVLLCEELGDVLLQVVFHARMAEERKAFDINDVCDGICKKLILRHPHIFNGENSIKTSSQVLDRWDEIKKAEKHQMSVTQAMNEVAKTLPALVYSEKIQKKAAKTDLNVSLPSPQTKEEEIGQKLFETVNEARVSGVDPEKALSDTAKQFIRLFSEQEFGR